MQGYLQLLEPNATVYCRKKDLEVTREAAKTAGRTYKEISGRDIQVEVEGSLNDEGYVSSANVQCNDK